MWEIGRVKARSYQLAYSLTKSKAKTPTDFSCMGPVPELADNFRLTVQLRTGW